MRLVVLQKGSRLEISLIYSFVLKHKEEENLQTLKGFEFLKNLYTIIADADK